MRNTPRKKSFLERTLDSSLSSIYNFWWFVLVLALSYHGNVTKHDIVHTAIMWSLAYLAWMIIVTLLTIAWEIYKARYPRYGRNSRIR